MTVKIVDFKKEPLCSDPNVVLEEAKDVFEKVLVIGYTKDGFLDGRASNNLSVADAHLLCAQMQQFFLDATTPDYIEE